MGKLNSITGRWLKRTYNLAHSSSYARFLVRQINDTLRDNPPDILVAPAFSTAMANLKTNIPIIYISDTTFRLLYGYYDWFSDFWPCSFREGNRIEKLTIQKSAFCIFASEWSAKSAIEDYQADPEKVKVIPFGANLTPSRDRMDEKEKGSKCRIIFIGLEWERKGGPLVLETFRIIKQSGISAQLDIVGCKPPISQPQPDIRIFPFIDKSTEEGLEFFSRLLAEQHFLFVPSRAECFGLVFAEASAFGIPSITTDTGGISSAVINGENGYRLPSDAGPADFARLILDIYQHFNEHYKPLSLSAFRLYKNQLNWERWASLISPYFIQAASGSMQDAGIRSNDY